MYIYKGTHLPRYGWLQGCFVCYAITGSLEDYQLSIKVENMRFVLYCCPLCRQIRKKSTELELKIRKQIEQYVVKKLAPS